MRDDRRTHVPAFRKIGTYLPMVTLLEIGTPMLIYLILMQTLGWQIPAYGANGIITTFTSNNDQTILYASQTTKDYFARTGGNYDTLLTPWREYFSSRKSGVNEVRDPTQLQKLKGSVLIQPSAVALNSEERTEILAFKARTEPS